MQNWNYNPTINLFTRPWIGLNLIKDTNWRVVPQHTFQNKLLRNVHQISLYNKYMRKYPDTSWKVELIRIVMNFMDFSIELLSVNHLNQNKYFSHYCSWERVTNFCLILQSYGLGGANTDCCWRVNQQTLVLAQRLVNQKLFK